MRTLNPGLLPSAAGLCGAALLASCAAPRGGVRLGVEVLLEDRPDLLHGKRVGLITNPSGVTRTLGGIADALAAAPDVRLVALYAPEHGLRGNAQAGEAVASGVDPVHGIPVFSLYAEPGGAGPETSGAPADADARMRAFDTSDRGKVPDPSIFRDVDVVVFDIQDVGTRIYTYIATMAHCMRACAERGIEFVVLDRPNPIGGIDMEGPVLDYPRYSSFVGLYPIPVRHGMTTGELARLFNDRFLPRKAALTVVPLRGWRREMWFDETGLPWVLPSPNMPTLDTAAVYPGQVFLEGTNVSEGRGTTRPFEVFGAPWIDGRELARRLNALGLPGAAFREVWFTPSFSKHRGELCGGAQIHVTSRSAFRPFETSLHVIRTLRSMAPDRLRFHPEYFDAIMGTPAVREAIERGEEVREIIARHRPGLEEFARMRKAYLLY